ncbi:glycine cleavage system aminomethyltransferase GcvT [Jeotgalibaca sp. MA1X17-3]|uniref:glycine cleavage system aminomethyltransferase GcvT n=1 Tax=Jeotgalibaca sp. MA1X17-3 TaxID=2908211 RepID=UPI001F025E74|nr:glycine cleavage system aminomethyltransferase GcvT [Jeotgalibaca sp. MA1X17-3]UJF16495.1 glycine cleavage system aminomethyltransferase GcvT [Jeotgalibaca sp. MA1X17-3]
MVENQTLKQTPLYNYYREQGIKVADFGGWAMPIQFSSILKEHEAVREKVGIFDCSHMGEIMITGPNAETYLDRLLTNDVSKMQDYSVQYNLLCTENGGVVDDVMLYRYCTEEFMLVCNASNTKKVFEWMKLYLVGNVELKDISEKMGLIAVQGPSAEMIVQKMTDTDLKNISRHHFLVQQTISGIPSILISRTGYTGEDGFELYVDTKKTRELWEFFIDAIREIDGLPCGLGARDTLRLEAGLPLYGQELSEEQTPLEAGLNFAVKLKKESPFIGKEALLKQKEVGVTQKIVGFITLERGVPRHGYNVYSEEDQHIGVVTSGTMSPTLHKGIGMALIDEAYSKMGTKIKIEIRNKYIQAEVVKKTFLK